MDKISGAKLPVDVGDTALADVMDETDNCCTKSVAVVADDSTVLVVMAEEEAVAAERD
jgi:arginine repressor